MRSVFTASLTKEVKKTNTVCIELDETSGFVYVSTRAFLVRLNQKEYDRFIRPITNCDPGTFSFVNGECTNDSIMRDMKELLQKTHTESVYNLVPAPIKFDYSDFNPSNNVKCEIVTYYSYESDFVVGFNSNYNHIIRPTLYRGKNTTSPMVCYDGMEPVCLISPLRISKEGKPSRISAAVKAYFKAQTESKI